MLLETKQISHRQDKGQFQSAQVFSIVMSDNVDSLKSVHVPMSDR